MTKAQLLAGISDICRAAGAAILAIYQRDDLGIQTKADDSPLTAADLAAHAIIVAGLARLAAEIPILSEESAEIPFAERSTWTRYFLVDPLDGTKEFIRRNGEFTVNIALIERHKATLGVVYVPLQDTLYVGINDADTQLAYVEQAGQKTTLKTRLMVADKITIMASRRHSDRQMAACLASLQDRFNVTLENLGSSLKFCRLAEGHGDLYPRLAPTSEWDTAAAQAVVEAAGGRLVDSQFKPLTYNTKENIINPYFYALADPSYDWRSALPYIKC